MVTMLEPARSASRVVLRSGINDYAALGTRLQVERTDGEVSSAKYFRQVWRQADGPS